MGQNLTKGNLWGFIQSRPYATVADLRRQFDLDTDGATPIRIAQRIAYIGLPSRGANLIRQLVREGRIALDYLPDIRGHVVAGVYAIHSPSRASSQSTARKRHPRPRRKAPASATPSPAEAPGSQR